MYYFLGPKSEQRAFLEEVFSLVFNDHAFWRRNFHPKDPPVLSYQELQHDKSIEFKETFYQELFSLISDLKLDVPFFSPRYMAHIISEPSLPGLVAYMATMFYNPNNVSHEASPVTIKYELEVGKQLAVMFGFDPSRSFGHLTSGGTVANYESLWINKAAKFLPLSVLWACEEVGLPLPEGLPERYWELMNLPLEQLEEIWSSFSLGMIEHGHEPFSMVRRLSPAGMGERTFWRTVSSRWGEKSQEPVVLLPETAHYSWKRAASVFGIGHQCFLKIPVDRSFGMCPDAYERELRRCREKQIPILQTVSVVGTTEFGSVDPLDSLVKARDAAAQEGLYSPIHVDAAFGGYFITMFQEGKQSLDEKRVAFQTQPRMQEIANVFQAMQHCDSVTVDPHKMGYAPYGAGAFVLKNGFLKSFVSESAAYALDQRTAGGDFHLGQYILEGSKPGAAAAAVWFSHRMMPLNTDGYGRLLLDLCEQSQLFYEQVEVKNKQLPENSPFHLVLIPPQLNVVGFIVWNKAAKSIAENNEINNHLIQRFGVREVESIQQYDYLVSHTTIPVESAFGVHCSEFSSMTVDTAGLDVMRFVFMNQWSSKQGSHGKPYMEDFLDLMIEECYAFLCR